MFLHIKKNDYNMPYYPPGEKKTTQHPNNFSKEYPISKIDLQ